MENTTASVTPAAVGLRYGLLTGLVGSIISFVLNMSHLEQSPAKWLNALVLVGGMVLAMQFYKKANAGFMDYGQGIGIGVLLAAVSGVVSAAFSYIYTHFVDTEMMGRILDKVRSDMEAKGSMSDDQMDQALGITRKMMTEPIFSLTVVLGSVMLGLVVALIVAAIVKNPQPEFE